MTRILDEQLSALLDGELPVEQEVLLLRRLDNEPGLRAKLGRYGLIGELIRDASTPAASLSVSGRVSAAIAAETAVDQTAVPSSSPSSVGVGLIGAGIAASIALAVMLNLSGIGNAARQTVDGEVTASGPAAHAHADVMAVDPQRLTRYLVSHSQYTNSASRQLFNSHVAMAAVEPAAWASHE